MNKNKIIQELLRSDIEELYNSLDPLKNEYILLQTVDNDEYKIYSGTKWEDDEDHLLIGPKDDKTKVFYNNIIQMDKMPKEAENLPDAAINTNTSIQSLEQPETDAKEIKPTTNDEFKTELKEYVKKFIHNVLNS